MHHILLISTLYFRNILVAKPPDLHTSEELRYLFPSLHPYNSSGLPLGRWRKDKTWPLLTVEVSAVAQEDIWLMSPKFLEVLAWSSVTADLQGRSVGEKWGVCVFCQDCGELGCIQSASAACSTVRLAVWRPEHLGATDQLRCSVYCRSVSDIHVTSNYLVCMTITRSCEWIWKRKKAK